MKLKYYMRGVGVGMIFTAFIFVVIIIPNLELDSKHASSVVPREGSLEKVTDILGSGADEEKAKEPEAGAVKNGDTSAVETTGGETSTVSDEINLIDKLEGTEKDEMPGETDNVPDADNSEDPDTVTLESPSLEESAQVVLDTAGGSPSVAEDEAAEENGQSSTVSAVITIGHGSTSEEVTMNLERAGIVESWIRLNEYMISNGYAERLQSGDYEVDSGMSYDEICKKFTRNY